MKAHKGNIFTWITYKEGFYVIVEKSITKDYIRVLKQITDENYISENYIRSS